MSQRPSSRWLSILALMLCLFGLSAKDFFTRGEAREAVVIQSIAQDDRWILPQGYSGAIPSKPPVMHWMAAAFWQLVPETPELMIRLPSFLGALLFVWGFYAVVKNRTNDAQRSWIAALILLSSLEWFRAALAARVDMILAVTICTGTYFSFRGLESRSLAKTICAGLILGIGVLAKGPVAVALWGSALGMLILLRRRKTFWTDIAFLSLTGAIALIVGASWYYAAYLIHPQEFIDKVYYENVARFLSQQDDEPHKKNFVGFWLLFWVGLLPWSFILLSKAPVLWREKKLLRKKLADLSDFELLLVIQIVSAVIFFSIPEGKRSVYLLPVYPAAACLLSASITDLGKKSRKSATILLYILAGCWAMVLMLPLVPTCESPLCFGTQTYVQQINQTPLGLLLLGLILPLATVALAKLYNSNIHRCSVLIIGILVTLQVVWFTVPANAVSPRRFLQESEILQNPTEPLFSWGNEFYAIAFYLQKPVIRLEEKVERHELKQTHGLVFFYPDREDALKKLIPDLLVVDRSGYGIVEADTPVLVGRF